MKHEFTNTPLRQAVADYLEDAEVDLSISALGESFWTQQVKLLRKMLDALPEPATDDWQECGFNELHATDKRVKAVFIGGSIIEGTPDRRNHEHVFLVDGPVIHSYDDATFYRIPAPVVAPDPEEHPAIYVKDSDIVGFIPKIMVWYRDFYVAGRQCLSPEQITDWHPIDPAKVVGDDR